MGIGGEIKKMTRYLDGMKSAAIMGTGAVIGFLFGNMDGILIALLTFMALDYLTGLINGAVHRTLCSSVGFRGLMRKCAILICVIVSNILDRYVLGGDAAPCRSMVILFFLANEGLSILENVGGVGIPIPERLKDIIEKLKEDP